MRKSRLSAAEQDRPMAHFVAGTTARCAAALVGVNRKTAAYYFHRPREIICYHLELEADRVTGGGIEVDASYFGGRRKGRRGRGAAGKVPVFGLLKRGGRVYTKIIPDARPDTSRIFNQPTCRHAPEGHGGIRESEAAEMLKAFFRDRR